MGKPLTDADIDIKVKDDIYIQDYSPKKPIDGVKIISLKNFVGDEGDFNEILRINDQGEVESVAGFKIRQISRTRLFPGSVKAWHLHFTQDEIWYVAPQDHLLVGLWDLRKESKTTGNAVKHVLGGGATQLLFIPKGVAHGLTVVSKESVNLYYFMNQQFDPNKPDERRIRWDYLGADFWKPQRD